MEDQLKLFLDGNENPAKEPPWGPFAATPRNGSTPIDQWTKPSGRASMKRRISDLLLAIGIPPQLKGYRLLSCAAELRLEEEVPFGRSAKALYAQLAERFGSDPQKVERAIHHAIELAWARDGGKSLSRAMGFPLYAPHNKPGNSEFIALLADKLRLERQG